MGSSSQQISPGVPGAVSGLTNQLQGMASKTTAPVTPYSGKYAANLTGGQNNALNSLRGLTYGSNPLYGQGSQTLSNILGGKYLDPSSNPFLSSTADAITSRAQKGLGQALDNYDSGANRAGAFNSTGANALRRSAFNDYSQNLTGALSSLYNQNYQTGTSNQLSALSQALGYSEQPFNNTLSLYGAEALPQQTETANLQGGYQDFLRQQQQEQNNAQSPFNNLLSLLGSYPLSYPAYTAGSDPYTDVGSLLTGLGSAGTGYYNFSRA